MRIQTQMKHLHQSALEKSTVEKVAPNQGQCPWLAVPSPAQILYHPQLLWATCARNHYNIEIYLTSSTHVNANVMGVSWGRQISLTFTCVDVPRH